MTEQPTDGDPAPPGSGDEKRVRVPLSDFAGVDPSGATTSPRHTASVQAAIDEVARRGDVLVWDGAYPVHLPVDAALPHPDRGLGDGRSRAVGTWTAEPEGPGVFRNAEFDGTATDIHLEGLEVVGTPRREPLGDTETSGRPAHGIRLYQVSEVSVTRCRIHHVAGMGINHQGCRRFHFDDNEVYSIGRDGITGYYADPHEHVRRHGQPQPHLGGRRRRHRLLGHAATRGQRRHHPGDRHRRPGPDRGGRPRLRGPGSPSATWDRPSPSPAPARPATPTRPPSPHGCRSSG